VRREGGEQGRRYNPQLSHYRDAKDSREASPYRALNDRNNGYSHQYILPRASPMHNRDPSRNSRSSVSKGKLTPVRPKDNEIGGLGSKL
jgi:hypothetical protein